MEIKSFKIKIDYDGSFQFLDERDRKAFVRTLSFLHQRKDVKVLELNIALIEEKSTVKQQNLFKLLCRKMNESSTYPYEVIYSSFLEYFGYDKIEDFPKERYNELLEYAIMMAQNQFGMQISISEDNNHIEIM